MEQLTIEQAIVNYLNTSVFLQMYFGVNLNNVKAHLLHCGFSELPDDKFLKDIINNNFQENMVATIKYV